MKKIITILLMGVCFHLQAIEPLALFQIGGGYWDAGKHHSTGFVQAQYKWGTYFWSCLRPQATCIIPGFESFFVGAGIAAELYVKRYFLLSPNFSPGFYYKGSGRDLGCVLEFRSGIEVAYELQNATRFGAELYHISNAHLGDRNPGANGVALFIAVPLH